MAQSEDFIPVAMPLLGEAEIQAVARPIGSGWVSQGPEIAAFETEFAAHVGASHACAVSSCTTALHLALLTVGVQPGDEVITASHSYIATANAIRYCGALPVFVDIDPKTYNLEAAKIASAIGPRTKAILCIHQLGMPCDLVEILKVAAASNLPVVEDAACAIGSEILTDEIWQPIGRPHGDIACFSFHPRKVITTGDGGMLTTNNPDFDQRFRLLRQHSMSVPDSVRHQSKDVIFENYPELGFNYRLTDIQASIGREQLKRLPSIVKTRRALAERYFDILSDIDGLELPTEPRWARSNWQSYCVRLPPDRDQKDVMQALLEKNIATRRGVMCAHREGAYPPNTWACGAMPESCGNHLEGCRNLIESERAQDQAIVLPLFAQMSEAQQDRVHDALKAALES